MSHALTIERTSTPRTKPADAVLGFGKYFSDHVFEAVHHEHGGWTSTSVKPYHALSLDPGAAVLHYGQALFDGLKAFRGVDGVVRVFRLDKHCHRMASGAPRLCLPAFEPGMLRAGIEALVDVDRDWVPSSPGTALYLRPTLIATEAFLGVRPSHENLLFVIASPVGAYYAEGMNPVKIWVERHMVRAAKGGLGAVKAGANYAASLLAAEHAKKKGYTQVLWLDAKEHRYLEEVGTMNLFVVIGDELITPPLDGTILGGVTRDTVLALAREWGWTAHERHIAFDELLAAEADGTLKEVFGSGTAAVISPVGELGDGERTIHVNGGKIGPIAQRLYDEITGIQYGRIPDRHGWTTVVPTRG